MPCFFSTWATFFHPRLWRVAAAIVEWLQRPKENSPNIVSIGNFFPAIVCIKTIKQNLIIWASVLFRCFPPQFHDLLVSFQIWLEHQETCIETRFQNTRSGARDGGKMFRDLKKFINIGHVISININYFIKLCLGPREILSVLILSPKGLPKSPLFRSPPNLESIQLQSISSTKEFPSRRSEGRFVYLYSHFLIWAQS